MPTAYTMLGSVSIGGVAALVAIGTSRCLWCGCVAGIASALLGFALLSMVSYG